MADGPLGHGSFLPMAELLMNNFVQCIQKMQRERIKSLTPKQSMAAAFHEHANLFLQRTAWAGSCSSWFKQAKTDGPAMVTPLLWFERSRHDCANMRNSGQAVVYPTSESLKLRGLRTTRLST